MTTLCLTVIKCTGVAQALTLGNNITIFDVMASSNGTGIGTEDNECETGMIQSQAWDLEGFFLKDNTLITMVGGYDFEKGVSGHTSGDIFIDVNGDVEFGGAGANDSDQYGNDPITNAFGYDYVLDLNFICAYI